jgi:predicted RNase H-like nuclease
MACFVGIDGCKSGWFSVSLFEDQSWQFNVFSNIKEIWRGLNPSDIILIDIPIGLPDTGPEERICDVIAREKLGQPRAASVFPPPARPSLDCENREEASEMNYQLTGRRIGVQTWAISHKIIEVDQLLRSTPEARGKIREVHPELLFWALNNGTSMSHNKKRLEGFVERLNVLRRYFQYCDELVIEALVKFRRDEVQKDDILDAMAASVTGLKGYGCLSTIPANPEQDYYALPMEMVYWLKA